MTSTSLSLHLIRIAGGLGILQGITWIALSLACIILYYAGDININIEKYIDVISSYLYSSFLSSNDPPFEDQIVRRDVFHGLIWVHLIFNTIWLLGSFLVCLYNTNKSAKILKYWSYVTLIVSLWDLTTVIIYGADYHNCVKNKEILYQFACATGYLPVVAIAARGFTLWIINVIFAFVLYELSKSLKKETTASEELTVPNFASQPNNNNNNVVPHNTQQNFYDQRHPHEYNRPQAPPMPLPQNQQLGHPYIPDPDYQNLYPRRHH